MAREKACRLVSSNRRMPNSCVDADLATATPHKGAVRCGRAEDGVTRIYLLSFMHCPLSSTISFPVIPLELGRLSWQIC